MKKILGMGNALVDLLVQLPNDEILSTLNFPKGSMQLVDAELSGDIMQKLKSLSMEQASGGSAGNTIHAIAALGTDAGFIGKVGHDTFGSFYANDLMDAGIKPILLKSNTESGKAIAMISPDGERTFATYLGAAVELKASDLTEDMFKDFDIFHIEGYLVQNHELLREAMTLSKKAGNTISLDLASFNVVDENLAFLRDIIEKHVDIVFANEEEAKSFTQKEPLEALNEIAEITKIAVVKVGKKGAYIKTNGEITHVDALECPVKDTTGAGDLFASGFLHGLMQNWPMEKCGNAGTILAGKIIGKIGARLTKKEIEEIQLELSKL